MMLESYVKESASNREDQLSDFPEVKHPEKGPSAVSDVDVFIESDDHDIHYKTLSWQVCHSMNLPCLAANLTHCFVVCRSADDR